MEKEKRYRDFASFLRHRFGCRVQKISLDAGLTCPNRDGTVSRGGCIYCNSAGSGTGARRLGRNITEQIENGKRFLGKRYKAKKFLAYFQSFSNTYAPLNVLRELYGEALAQKEIVGICIGTRPDCVDDSKLDLLESIAVKNMVWIEYGLQSACDKTLALINRGHDFAAFREAVLATAGRGINIAAHVILGLPGEDRVQMMATADAVASLPIDGVKIHLLYVIRGTPMEELYRAGKYRCLGQEEYVELVCDFLERLRPETVILRLTGDPHKEELVAPGWSLKKRETLEMIAARLEQRDSWQGKNFPGSTR